MMPTDHLVRGMLRLLLTAYPGTLLAGELVEGVPALDVATADTLLKGLLAAGYAENVNNVVEPWYRITKAGMDQVQAAGALSRLVWGRKGTL